MFYAIVITVVMSHVIILFINYSYDSSEKTKNGRLAGIQSVGARFGARFATPDLE